MDNVIKSITVDLYSPTSYEVIKAQQGDNNSRIIEFILYNQGEPYTIAKNISIRMEGHRGDGSSFIKENCTVSNNIISAIIDSDILYEHGIVEAKLVMYNISNDAILSTIPFKIHVQKNPCDKNKVEADKKSLIDDILLIVDKTRKVLEEHINNFLNPHNVTKAQVGLGLVDNTPDVEKNVNSAKKLTTARKINNTLFDGTADITTDKWGKSRTVTLSGDVSGSKEIDGSSNVDISVTVKDNSHEHTVSNISDLTATASELNVLDGISSTTTELNKLHGTTATVDDFNKLHDVTASASELNIMDGVTATTTELNYVDGVTSNIQTQLNGKQPNITGGATTITSSNLTASRALISNSSGKVAVSDVTSTELGYLDGVTSSIQTQLDTKAPLASPTLTGTPKAPTATAGTNSTQIATTAFVQTAVSNLVNSAPETLDTLGEIADALKDNADIVDVLNESIATKANASDLTSHTSNTTVHITATERSNWNDANSKKHTHSNKSILDNTTASYTTAEQTKLSSIATGAEVNQNAFSNVVVGTTTISADSKTDSLTLTGSNVTLTPDTTNDKVTIGITKANVTSALGYTPPTTNTTYGVATSSTLGLVKSGTDITVDSSGNVSVNDDSHNHVISNVDGLQTALDGKANTSHGNHVPTTETANNARFLRNDNTWQTVTPTNIGAATSGHTHNYAGSSSAGGAATTALACTGNSVTATALTTSAGSATQPVYFSSGKPVACTYTLSKSVPSNAVFTDTVYTHPTTSGNKHIPSGGYSGQILRWAADGTAVWGTDYNTTYSNATTSAAGLMSASDKTKLDGIATGANNYTYTLPTASSSTLGGVKTTSTVTSSSGYTACPIISGVPYYKDTNTTYSAATTSANGLMTSAMVTKLNGIATGATANSVTTSLASTSTTTCLAASAGKSLQDQITSLNSNFMYVQVDKNSSKTITISSDNNVAILFLSIGATCNCYILKYNLVSDVFSTNSTTYLTVNCSSERTYTIKNTNTTSNASGMLISCINQF